MRLTKGAQLGPRLRQTPVLLLAGQLLTAGSAFLMNLLSSNALQPAERGLLAFFLQLSYVVTVISLLGVERPYVAARVASTFGTAYRELSRLTRTAWVGAAMITALSGYFALREQWLLAGLGIAAAGYVLINVAIRKIRIAFITSHDPAPFLGSVAGTQLPLLLVGVILLLLEVDSPLPWLAAYGMTGLAAPAIAAGVRRRWLRTAGSPAAGADLGAIRREGLRLLPASLGNSALLRSDRLLLPLLASPAELGRYIAVATIMELGTWPVQQWVDASLGKWRARAGRPLGARKIAIAMVVAISVTAAVGGVAYLIIQYLLPPAYRGSQELLLPLALGTVLYAGTRIQQGLMIARGAPGSVSIAEVSGMVASIVLYVVLMPTYGAMGAAIGSALGYFVLLVVAAVLAKRRAGRAGDGARAGQGSNTQGK